MLSNTYFTAPLLRLFCQHYIHGIFFSSPNPSPQSLTDFRTAFFKSSEGVSMCHILTKSFSTTSEALDPQLTHDFSVKKGGKWAGGVAVGVWVKSQILIYSAELHISGLRRVTLWMYLANGLKVIMRHAAAFIFKTEKLANNNQFNYPQNIYCRIGFVIQPQRRREEMRSDFLPAPCASIFQTVCRRYCPI